MTEKRLSLIFGKEGRVEDDFPQMIVRVLEVAGIAAPKGLLRGLDEAGAGSDRLAHHRIDFHFAADIVANGKFRRAARSPGNSRIMGDVAALEEREFDAELEFKEHHRAMLELLPDDAFGRKPEPVTIELQRCVKVIDAYRQHADPRFHERYLLLNNSITSHCPQAAWIS